MEFTEQEAKRFHSKYEVRESGCWEWIGAKFDAGYGMFTVSRSRGTRRTHMAHRVSWMIANKQEIPKGMVIRHMCDNRICVNPEHLKLGTYSENNRDTALRGRSNRSVGSACHWSKLTEDNVREILSSNAYGDQIRLARKFGVNQATVSQIKSGKRWKHLHRLFQTG